MDSRTQFDSLTTELASKASLEEGEIFAISRVSKAVQALSEERRAVLSRLAPGIETIRGAEAALALADLVSVAAAHAIRVIEKRSGEHREVSADFVDLWGKAEACRALWFETYVQWPTDRAAERRRALSETVLRLASELVGMALRFSTPNEQYIDFLAKVSGEIEQLRESNP